MDTVEGADIDKKTGILKAKEFIKDRVFAALPIIVGCRRLSRNLKIPPQPEIPFRTVRKIGMVVQRLLEATKTFLTPPLCIERQRQVEMRNGISWVSGNRFFKTADCFLGLPDRTQRGA